jgi:hypothetical protein
VDHAAFVHFVERRLEVVVDRVRQVARLELAERLTRDVLEQEGAAVDDAERAGDPRDALEAPEDRMLPPDEDRAEDAAGDGIARPEVLQDRAATVVGNEADDGREKPALVPQGWS